MYFIQKQMYKNIECQSPMKLKSGAKRSYREEKLVYREIKLVLLEKNERIIEIIARRSEAVG